MTFLALRTGAYEGDGELDGYSEDDTGSQGLPQGIYFHPRASLTLSR